MFGSEAPHLNVYKHFLESSKNVQMHMDEHGNVISIKAIEKHEKYRKCENELF